MVSTTFDRYNNFSTRSFRTSDTEVVVQRFQPLELFHGNSQHETITEDWNNHGSCLFYLAVKQILRQVTSLEFDDIRSIDTEVN